MVRGGSGSNSTATSTSSTRARRRTSTPTARTGSGAEGGTVDVLVVAADAPNDFRNHPLFSTSITDH